MKTVYTFLADGFEEIEATIPMDLCMRAGIQVKRVAVYTEKVQGNSGGTFLCDSHIESIHPDNEDILFLPGGGKGAKHLSESKPLSLLLEKHNQNNGIIAAICIAPAWVLGKYGLLKNKSYTCYPGGEKDVQDTTAVFLEQAVVKDGNIITSRGIGTAFQFAVALITTVLDDNSVAQKVWKETLLPLSTHQFPYQS